MEAGPGDSAAGAGGGDAGAGGSRDAAPGDGGNCAGMAVAFSANVPAGSDAARARVEVNFGTSTDLPTQNANRTIEFWAFVPSSAWAADANTLFFYGGDTRNMGTAGGFGLDFANPANGMGRIDPFVNLPALDNDNQPSGLSATSDQWAHFAVSWDGTAIRAFVNGVQMAMKSGTPSTLATASSVLVIGGYNGAYFNGYIDEFRIWNVARSAADIASTMHQTLVGNETGLTAYWKFDETTGTSAADSVTTAGHTAHAGTLMAANANQLPTWVRSTAPINCP
jgi:hypothetical protein